LALNLTTFERRRSRFIEKRDLLSGWRLKFLKPLQNGVSFNWRAFHAPSLNSVEKNVRRCRKVMQLNSGTKGARPCSQNISFSPSPRSPFDYYRSALHKKILSKLPLKSLNLTAPILIVNIY